MDHINADFRNDSNGAATVAAGDGTEKGDITLVLLNHNVNTGVHPANESVNVVEMVTDNTNAGLLLG